MERWDIQWSTIMTRSFLIHILPLLLHALDVAINQMKLIHLYQSVKPRIIFLWALFSYSIVGLLHDLNFPNEYDEVFENMDSSSSVIPDKRDILTNKVNFVRTNRLIFVVANIFAYILLKFLILNKVNKRIRTNHHNHQS